MQFCQLRSGPRPAVWAHSCAEGPFQGQGCKEAALPRQPLRFVSRVNPCVLPLHKGKFPGFLSSACTMSQHTEARGGCPSTHSASAYVLYFSERQGFSMCLLLYFFSLIFLFFLRLEAPTVMPLPKRSSNKIAFCLESINISLHENRCCKAVSFPLHFSRLFSCRPFLED